MKSSIMRGDPLFLRNEFSLDGRYEIPCMKGYGPFDGDISLVSYADTRANDKVENVHKGVHFFVDDYRFKGIYDHPESSLPKLKQYDFLLTPDYSLYAEMPLWRQMESVAKNRWVGAYWQSKGLIAIPSISWSTPKSYQFCFDGVEPGTVVALGMIGCKQSKENFLEGYSAMMDKLHPCQIIVFGSPFDEMDGNLLTVDYIQSRKVVR